tara:strand:+ start:53 stop:283 length:231 start_codon:yes stop_codon:yes gene_type:complete
MEKLEIGTKIKFTRNLYSSASADCPEFDYAIKEQLGEVTGHDCREGHMVKTDDREASFGAILNNEFVRLPNSTTQY